jgi:hypothetical protein
LTFPQVTRISVPSSIPGSSTRKGPLILNGPFFGSPVCREYKSLIRKGKAVTIAAIATYAYDQIDQARAELNAVSK